MCTDVDLLSGARERAGLVTLNIFSLGAEIFSGCESSLVPRVLGISTWRSGGAGRPCIQPNCAPKARARTAGEANTEQSALQLMIFGSSKLIPFVET